MLGFVDSFFDRQLAFLWEQTVPHCWLTCFAILGELCTSMEFFAEAGPSHSRTSEITPEQASLHFLLDFILLVGGELKCKQV